MTMTEKYKNTFPLSIIELLMYLWEKKIFIFYPFIVSLLVSLVLFFMIETKVKYSFNLVPIEADLLKKIKSSVEIRIPKSNFSFSEDLNRSPIPFDYYYISEEPDIIEIARLYNVYINQLNMALKLEDQYQIYNINNDYIHKNNYQISIISSTNAKINQSLKPAK